jgi:hypothetical protein
VDIDFDLQKQLGEVDHDGSKVVVCNVVTPAEAFPGHIHPWRVAADFGHYVWVQALGHERQNVRNQVPERLEAGAREDGVPQVPGAQWQSRDCGLVVDQLCMMLGDVCHRVCAVETALYVMHVRLKLERVFFGNLEINGCVVCCALHGLVTGVKLCDCGWKALQASVVGVLSVCFRIQFLNVDVRFVSVVGQLVEYALCEFWRYRDAQR